MEENIRMWLELRESSCRFRQLPLQATTCYWICGLADTVINGRISIPSIDSKKQVYSAITISGNLENPYIKRS